MKFLFISFLLLLIFIPRFWKFWTVDFTGDEATQVKKAVSVAKGIEHLVKLDSPKVAFKNIYTPILQHNHPPLEFLILIPFGLFEPREFFTRLVYVLIGSFSLISGYFIARNIFGRKLAGYYFIFYGTSAYAIWWSQTAINVSLAISAGVFISLAIVNFYFKANRRSLALLALSEAMGLLVFHDFIFFLPAIAWVIWDKRSFLRSSDFVLPFILFFMTAGVFYLNYIIYALTIGPKYAGFNYLLNSKIPARANVYLNIFGYLRNFFLYPGVVILLPFSVLTLIWWEKYRYLKYFFPVLVTYILVFVMKSPTPFHYLASTYGIFLLMATLGMGLLDPKIRSGVIVLVLAVNILGFVPIFGGVHNPQLFDASALNNMKVISELGKKCLDSDRETYISTDDTWKMTYYFGRQSTVERDGTETRIGTIFDFLDGRLSEVVLIHVRDDQIDDDKHKKLLQKSSQVLKFDRETVYLFKNCL